VKTTLEEAKEFFSDFFSGEHHIPGKIKDFGEGWCVNYGGDLSTYDAGRLTALVFLAHERCFRVELQQGGPHKIKICIWKRQREGSMWARHPTLDQAIDLFKKYHKKAGA